MTYEGTPIQAKIFWGPSITDPVHLIDIALPDGAAMTGTRWQRFLIKLLAKSILKRRKKAMKNLGDKYNKVVIG
jgi:hypothetical protein